MNKLSNEHKCRSFTAIFVLKLKFQTRTPLFLGHSVLHVFINKVTSGLYTHFPHFCGFNRELISPRFCPSGQKLSTTPPTSLPYLEIAKITLTDVECFSERISIALLVLTKIGRCQNIESITGIPNISSLFCFAASNLEVQQM